MTRARYHGNRQQPVHHVRRGAQVAGGLEQRHDPQRPRDAGFALQQLDREHVRRPAGLGDDVGAERIARHLRNHPKRRQDVGHRRLRPQPFGAEHALLRQDVRAGNRRAALRSTRRSCRVPCARAMASTASVCLADSWRTSSLTSVSPKATTRRSTSVSRPSAMRSLPTERSEASQRRSGSASSSSLVSGIGVELRLRRAGQLGLHHPDRGFDAPVQFDAAPRDTARARPGRGPAARDSRGPSTARSGASRSRARTASAPSSATSAPRAA